MTVADLRKKFLMYLGANESNYPEFLHDQEAKELWEEIHGEALLAVERLKYEELPDDIDQVPLPEERSQELLAKIHKIKVQKKTTTTTIH